MATATATTGVREMERRDKNFQRDGRTPRDGFAQGDRGTRQFNQTPRDLDAREYQGHKRGGDYQDHRDVRQMTERDMRYHLEGRRKNPTPQQYWDQGQSSSAPMKCYNCNDEGHHWSVCQKPPFCYSCKNTGHKLT
jgi:hypothetical protein